MRLQYIFVVALLLSAMNNSGKSEEDLRLAISSRTNVDTGLAAIEVTIINDGSYTYWVNSRMLWTAFSLPNEFGEVNLEIRDEANNAIRRACRTNIVPLDLSHYVLLRPGEYIGKVVPLDCAMLRAGKYRIKATYRNGGKISGFMPDYPRYDGQLVSPEIVIIVENKDR